MRRKWLLAIPAAAGAALAYLFDPDRGKARRNVLVDRTAALFRRTGRKAERLGRRVGAEAYGLKQKATHIRSERMPENDETLRDKVMSEVFTPRGFPKDRIVVNVENGVVHLRGEVDHPEQITEIEREVRGVLGVADVENLLHLPGVPAPNKEPARRR